MSGKEKENLKPLEATVLYKDKKGKLRSANVDMIKYLEKENKRQVKRK